MDIAVRSLRRGEFHRLAELMSASVSDVGPSPAPLGRWRRRPLSPADQSSALLLGLAMMHSSIVAVRRPPHNDPPLEVSAAIDFLRNLVGCYPRLASRVAPNVIGLIGTCDDPSVAIELLTFLATECAGSSGDPHGAHLVWTHLSSLAGDDAPVAVRSTAIRLLPGMCAGNKRLLRRSLDIIGRSMMAG